MNAFQLIQPESHGLPIRMSSASPLLRSDERSDGLVSTPSTRAADIDDGAQVVLLGAA